MKDKNIILLFDEDQTRYAQLDFTNDYLKEANTEIVYSKRDDDYPKIIPIFYINSEDQIYIDKWEFETIGFLNRHKDFLEKEKNKIVICDLLESNKTLLKTVKRISKFIQSKIYIVSPEKLKTNDPQIIHITNPIFYKFLEPVKKVVKYKPKKIYMNLNRAYRYHRASLIEKIFDNNLAKYGYTTFADAYKQMYQYYEQHPETNFKNYKFDILDEPDLKNVNPVYKFPKQCKYCFLFLNTETWVDNNKMFLTEKSFKAPAIGMPFINLGCPGTLDRMRELGYYTFAPWIDESYDFDLPLQTRIQIIVDNLKRFSTYDEKHLIKIRNQMAERVKHNFELYNTLYNKNYTYDNFNLITNGAV